MTKSIQDKAHNRFFALVMVVASFVLATGCQNGSPRSGSSISSAEIEKPVYFNTKAEVILDGRLVEFYLRAYDTYPKYTADLWIYSPEYEYGYKVENLWLRMERGVFQVIGQEFHQCWPEDWRVDFLREDFTDQDFDSDLIESLFDEDNFRGCEFRAIYENYDQNWF